MTKKGKLLFWALSLLFLLPPVAVLIALQLSGQLPQETVSSAPEVSSTASISEPEPVPKPQSASATLLAVGDNLIHDALYLQAGRRTNGNGYDFRPVYERVQNAISGADIAFINQETMMAKDQPPSNYPLFNTPRDLAPQLAEIGFDVVNLANNHMLDMGREGLLDTIDLLDSIPAITRIGGYHSREEMQEIPLIEKNGITFAFIGCADYTNVGGTKTAEDLILFTHDRETLSALIQSARQQADIVVVSVHFGNEGTNIPSDAQRSLAQFFCEEGVDIVLGHHPHVIQPVEMLQSASGHETLVFFSLGNFVSAQHEPKNLVGLMPKVTVTKEDGTEAYIESVELSAVVTHYGSGVRDISLYPLEEYTDALAQEHGVNSLGYGTISLDFIYSLLDDTLSSPYWPPDT